MIFPTQKLMLFSFSHFSHASSVLVLGANQDCSVYTKYDLLCFFFLAVTDDEEKKEV